MGAASANVALFAALLALGLSLLLFAASLLAWARLRSVKLLMTAFAFGPLAALAATLAWLTWRGGYPETPTLLLSLLTLAALVPLHVAVVRRAA